MTQNQDQQALESLLINVDELLSFLSLSTHHKSEHLMTIVRGDVEGERRTEALLRLIGDQEAFRRIKAALDDNGCAVATEWHGPDADQAVFDTACQGVSSQFSRSSFRQLRSHSALFADNLAYLRELWEQRFPGRSAHEFYQDLIQESVRTGVSLMLLVIGIIPVGGSNSSIDRLLRTRRGTTSFCHTPIRYVTLGGGGHMACRIGRSVRWIAEHNYQTPQRFPGYDCGSIVTPFDNGGSSQKDADAVRNLYNRQVISPGDLASVLSWQTVSDAAWPAVNRKGNLDPYHPPNTDAVMNLLFTYVNRITVPEGHTLEEVITKRIREVNGEPRLLKPHHWFAFIVNLRAAAKIIDEKLIQVGQLLEIRTQPTSVQNLLLLALAMAYGLNMRRANREIHQILGLKRTFALSSSFEEVVLAMRLETADGKTNRAILGHLNIVNDARSYIGKPYQMLMLQKGSVQVTAATSVQDMETNGSRLALPSANPDAIHAIRNAQRAILMGMGSAFDSLLANLLVSGIPEAIQAAIRKGARSVYLPKLTQELQTEGLCLWEVMQVMERSIQQQHSDPDFRIEHVMTHVFLPQIPEDLVNRNFDEARLQRMKYLNSDGKRCAKHASTCQELVDIFRDASNWSHHTSSLVESGVIKEAKLVPGTSFTFGDPDREFLESRGLNVVTATAEETKRLFLILEERLNYDTNEVVRLVDRVVAQG